MDGMNRHVVLCELETINIRRNASATIHATYDEPVADAGASKGTRVLEAEVMVWDYTRVFIAARNAVVGKGLVDWGDTQLLENLVMDFLQDEALLAMSTQHFAKFECSSVDTVDTRGGRNRVSEF